MSGIAANAAITTTSGNAEVDALLWDRHWNTNNLTFSFPTGTAEYAYGAQTFNVLLAQQQTAVNEILAQYSAISNLTFAAPAAGTNANLRFARAFATDRNVDGSFTTGDVAGTPAVEPDERVTTAYGIPPSNTAPSNYNPREWGDMWFNVNAAGGTNDMTNPLKGNYGYHTILHEIGHVLGMDHPHGDASIGNHFGNLAGPWDSMEFTVMTYRSYVGDPLAGGYSNATDGYAQSLMVLDIAAIQSVYGANFNTNNTDTTYKWRPTTGNMEINGAAEAAGTAPAGNFIFRTIWDGGGVDTYDFSSYGTNLAVDLRPGDLFDPNVGWIILDTSAARAQRADLGDSNWARGNIANARRFDNSVRAFIENAAGGTGNDSLVGNEVANRLYGNDGGDTLQGLDSGDYLYGGAGDDALYGGAGYDWLVGGGGGDYLDGGFERDTASYEGSYTPIVGDLHLGKVLYGDAAGDTIVSIESLRGSEVNDELQGNSEYNVLSGGGGNDEIRGLGGRDNLNGDSGDDTIEGVQGDYIDGGTGTDTIIFSATSETFVSFDREFFTSGGAALGVTNLTSIENFHGKAGVDSMFGDSAGENFFGFGSDDVLNGRGGNDILEGGAGADSLTGGDGSDTASYAGSAQGVAADIGVGKYLYGDAQGDTLAGIENLTGSAFDDDLRGDANLNVLRGLGGNDDLYDGFGGADLLEGGLGDDTYIVSSDLSRVREAVGQGNDRVIASATFRLEQFLAEVEIMQTNDANAATAINLYGSNHTNTIYGNAGNNILSGRGGNDFLVTGIGADTMDGGDGYDTMVFHKAMVADWQSGVLDADIGGDGWIAWEAIQGSSGADRIRTNSWGYAVELRGGGGDDVLATGVSGLVNDILRGEDGNDEMNGGAGADAMTGGLGNDTYYVDNAGDSVTELAGAGSGVDWVRAALSAYTLGANVEKLAFTDTGDHVGKGNALANTLNGNAGDDKFIMDAGGNDVFSGGGGSDSMDFRASALGAAINLATGVHGGAALGDIFASIEKFFGSNTGADTMRAGAGRANFSGFGGDDTLIGGNNTDTVSGGDGADTLFGGSGADTLWGGKGNDRMNGGSGEDLFLYVETAASGGWGADTITDFQDGVDLIKIDAPGVADAFSDFTVTGNGTANVLIRLAAAPANTITLQGAAPITISAADFLFY